VYRSLVPLIALGLVSVGFGQVERGFVNKTLQLDGETHRYQVFVPEAWSPLEEWPVILFLHGAGERGTDGVAQTRVGIGPALRANKDSFPALVVLPQCRRGVWWNDETMEKVAFASLQRTIEEYKGDDNRIYLTGISMGGYGTFYFGARYPERFAALVPICGGIVPPFRGRIASPPQTGDPYAEAARKIGQTPVWIFHGGADPVVPVSESRHMRDELQKRSIHVKYTEYEGVGHNSWDRAYAEPGLFGWMLSQRR
jgi:predicted peptidase